MTRAFQFSNLENIRTGMNGSRGVYRVQCSHATVTLPGLLHREGAPRTQIIERPPVRASSAARPWPAAFPSAAFQIGTLCDTYYLCNVMCSNFKCFHVYSLAYFPRYFSLDGFRLEGKIGDHRA